MLPSGDFDVEETIEVFFNEKRRGIFRTIPYIYNIEGQRHQIKLRNFSSASHKYKISQKRGNRILRMGDTNKYLTGSQTYKISYQVTNAYMDREDELEFFWNLTGNDWEVPIERMEYKISFPGQVSLSEDNLRIFSGPYGSRYSEVENTIEGSYLSGFSTTPIYPGSGLSVAVIMPKTVFKGAAIPLTQQRKTRDPLSKRSLVADKYYPIPLFLLTLFGWLYWNQGRDPKDPVVRLQHHPPQDMHPTEVGTFYDFKVHDRDLLAMIPKWGNEGLVKVSSTFSSTGDEELYFSRLGELSPDAPGYESVLFNGLFRDSDLVRLSDIENKFYKVFRKSRSMVEKDHLFSDLFDQESKSKFHGNWLIALVALLIITGVILIVVFQLFITGISSIVLAFMGLIIKSQRPRLSERGLQLNRKLIGFEQFLSNPDPKALSRLREEDPDYLQNVFPYVVAFGLDDKWNIVLEDMSVPPPYWYENDRAERTSYGGFSKAFQVREISSAFRSMPASEGSSGGGFGGGGSGGGFGGGGGGSW